MLARWSGWGAAAAVFDEKVEKYAWAREELAQLLDEKELKAAARTTINAHYTDAALAKSIWEGIGKLGWSGGRGLEPGCGSGTFLGLAPANAQMTGIELDPITAAIAAALYPHADVRAESFAHTRAREGSFDVVVGNVPFGDIRLHDRRHNAGNHAIHNHFIIKSLRLTRPGGLVAVITSAYTMDAANPAARREMQQLGDLVGAVRLPSKAHARAAGTDALTDVLILRRREADRPPAPFDWEYSQPIEVGDETVRINTYFIKHPGRVLGELATGDGLYRSAELSVIGDPAAAPAQLATALDQVAEEAREAGLTMTPLNPAQIVSRPAALLPTNASRAPGYLEAHRDGTFTRWDEDGPEPYHPPKSQAAELRALLRLRDAAVKLLEAEAATVEDTDETDALRAELNNRYDQYKAQYGPINRFTLREQKRRDPVTQQSRPVMDEQTGQPKTMRIRPAQGGFRTDPFAPVVAALENFNEETQTARKADIFRQRVVAQRPQRLGADTPADALAIVRDEDGEVRLSKIAWLLGVDEEEAREALGTLVYDDPVTGRLEPASAYLSGNVRDKLAAARAAAEEDPRFEVNVTALTEVIPRDLGPDEITAPMGAPWIDQDYVRQFLAEILEDPDIEVEHAGGSMWEVHSFRNGSVAATSTWGTDRMPGPELAQHILEQRSIKIVDIVEVNGVEKRIPNLDATIAANEKAVEMRERWAEWIWSDPERTATLVRKYNDLFNSEVLRSYDDVQLSLPGLSMTNRKPRPHQVAAVARMIAEPGVGLYHSVGAGKTMAMIMGVMELRRLGLVRKPMIVVPNNMLEQFAREFLQTYPRAKILAATKDDLAGDKRRALVARVATGDWDAVIMTEGGFLRLPMSPEAQERYVEKQLEDIQELLDKAEARGNERSVKRLQRKLARKEQRTEKKLDGEKDQGIWFELTGIDYIVRDESDRDKNLMSASNLEGMSIDGSQRASQMDMKLQYLREKYSRWGVRATGTPVANSMVELYTEFRYLRPDLMKRLGIRDLDSFLATFAEPVTSIEVTPDGGGLRNKTRVAKFFNVPELIKQLHIFADVKTKDDLKLPRPPLAMRPDGQRLPEVVVVPPSEELLERVAEHVKRAEKVRGRKAEKGDDNILKIIGEARRDALDLRINGGHTDEPQKVDVAADKIAEIWREHADRIYLDPNGEEHPTPGALQLVFCDMGTPNKDRDWNVYDELRDQLVARGMPREKIRFIHEADTDRKKWELFQAARDGRISVLIGSTEKMGAGTNVQDRAVALHHLDPQWRPRDIEQREGRIDRQGNQNPEIRILRYVTERSFDAYMWQTVERKARFIDQIMRGHYDGREAEDLGDGTMSAEEMKAAATGNPLLVDHAVAKATLTRLERLERAHGRNLGQLRWTIRDAEQSNTIDTSLVQEIDQAIARRIDTRGDKFAMTLGGRTHSKRSEASNQLKTLLFGRLGAERGSTVELGELGGFTLIATTTRYINMEGRGAAIDLSLRGCPGSEITVHDKELPTADLVTRLENRLHKLESLRSRTLADISRREAVVKRAQHELTKPFRYAEALEDARRQFLELDAQVTALAEAEERAAAEAAKAGQEEAPQESAAGNGEAAVEAESAGSSPASAHSGPGKVTPPDDGHPQPGNQATAGSGADRPDDADRGLPPATPAPVPSPYKPVAGVVDDLLRWAYNDELLLRSARANDRHNFGLFARPRLEERILDAISARPDDDELQAFARIHLGENADRLYAFLIEQVALHAETPQPLPTDTVPPDLWAVTFPQHPARPGHTVLVPAAAVETAVMDAVARTGEVSINIDADQRTTLRDVDGRASYCAEPAQLAWRGWMPKEAETLDLGKGPLTSYQYGGSSGGNTWTQADVRDALRRAQAASKPVAVTDWGVVTHFGGQPVIFVRQGATIPRVPEASGPRTAHPDALPSLLQPFADRIAGLLERATRDEAVVQAARTNSASKFRTVSDPWVLGEVAAMLDDDEDPAATAFVTAYLDDAAIGEAINTYVAEQLHDRLNPTAPHNPAIDGSIGQDAKPAPLPEKHRRRRGHAFYPPPGAAIPTTAEARALRREDRTLYLHYFGGSYDYWIAGLDQDTGLAYGYVCINNDDANAEWCDIYLPEIEQLSRGLLIIERDLDWEPTTAVEAGLPGWRALGRSQVAQAPAADDAATDRDIAATTEGGPDDADDPSAQPAAADTPERETKIATSTETALPATPSASGGPAGVGTTVFAEFAGGSPYTSANRIRGPLQDVRKAYNALARTAGWKRGLASPDGGRRIKQLAAIADLFADVRVSETDPSILLSRSVTVARHARELWHHKNELDHPAQVMLNNLVRVADELAKNLVATLQKDGRWERVFGAPPTGQKEGPQQKTFANQDGQGFPAGAADRATRVHRFDSSGEAYDASQVHDEIRSGDVLVVASEGVVGVLDKAWPVALTQEHGEFHTLQPDARAAFAASYQAGITLAEAEMEKLAGAPASARPVPGPLKAVETGDNITAASGQHRVSRRIVGRTVYVQSHHPQMGLLARGRIDLMPPGRIDGEPQFKVTDHDGTASDEVFVDYHEAEKYLLRLTAALDDLVPPEEAEDLLAAEDDRPTTPNQPPVDRSVTEDAAGPQLAAGTAEAGGVPPETLHEPTPPDAVRPDAKAPARASGSGDTAARAEPASEPPQQNPSPKAGANGGQLTQLARIDPRHPEAMVACTCCRPGGGHAAPADPVTNAQANFRSGPFAYVRGPVGIMKGRTWLKVVSINDQGTSSNALAFVSLRADEWYGAASWGKPNKSRPLDDAERQWIIRLLPYLDPAPRAATPPNAAEEGIRLHVDGQRVMVLGTKGGPDEEPLRTVMRKNGFYFDGDGTNAWLLGGWRARRGTQADRDAAAAAVQRWIDANTSRSAGEGARKFPPTPQQQAIIDAYLDGKDIVVQALAGTGKTSTLQLLAAARPESRIAYIAFNASIAKEAAGKFTRNVTAKTSHSFAKAALRNGPLRDKLNRVGKYGTGKKWPDEWAQVLGISDVPHGDGVVEAETRARWVMQTVKAFRESAAEQITAAHLPEGLRDPAMASQAAPVLDYARRAWENICSPDGDLFFTHDDYLKIWALTHPRMVFDVIFFDEAQDINDVLRKLIQDQQPTQTVVVGDSNQSIYGFRGAIDALNGWPADVTLPLTQSWRFGQAVADVGNEFLKLLKSPYLLTGNPGMTSRVGDVNDPNAVLCRTNAGAVAAVFDGFDADQKVALVGGGDAIKDIAKAALELQNGRGTKHPELSRFPDWKAVQEFVEQDEHAQSLRAFVRLVDRRGAQALIDMADQLVDEEAIRADGSPAYDLIVSTAHKSKGLEWKTVRIAGDFPQPNVEEGTGKVTLPNPEELRLAYVAVSRGREAVELGSLSWIRDQQLMEQVMRQQQRRSKQSLPAAVPHQAAPVEPTAGAAPVAARTRDDLAGLDVLVPAAPGTSAATNTQTPTTPGDRTHAAALHDTTPSNGPTVQASSPTAEPVKPAPEPTVDVSATGPDLQLALPIGGSDDETTRKPAGAMRQIPVEEVVWGMYGRIKAMGPDGSRYEMTGYVTLVPREFTGGLGEKQKHKGDPVLHFVMMYPSRDGRAGSSVGMNALPGTMFTVLNPPEDQPLRMKPSDSRRMPVADVRAGDIVGVLLPEEGRHRERPGPHLHLIEDPKPLGGGAYELIGLVGGVVEKHQMFGDTWVDVQGPAVRHLIQQAQAPAAPPTDGAGRVPELPPPGETDPADRWKLLGEVSMGAEPASMARKQRMFAAMRRVHDLPDDASYEAIRAARDADTRQWKAKCLAYWDAYAVLMAEERVQRTAAAEPYPKAVSDEVVEPQAAPAEVSATTTADEASADTAAGPTVPADGTPPSSRPAPPNPADDDRDIDLVADGDAIRDEARRLLLAADAETDIRWAAGAYFLVDAEGLVSFWQARDVKLLRPISAGRQDIDDRRALLLGTKGVTLTVDGEMITTASWNEIAELVAPAKVTRDLRNRLAAAVDALAAAEPASDAPEHVEDARARWEEVSVECERLAATVWYRARPMAEDLFASAGAARTVHAGRDSAAPTEQQPPASPDTTLVEAADDVQPLTGTSGGNESPAAAVADATTAGSPTDETTDSAEQSPDEGATGEDASTSEGKPPTLSSPELIAGATARPTHRTDQVVTHQDVAREAALILSTVPRGGDIRWAAGAYHLRHISNLVAYWQTGDHGRLISGGPGGSTLDGGRLFQHDAHGCSVTEGLNTTVATATWREIAAFITASRVGADLVARADAALQARREMAQENSERSTETQEQWFQIEDECRQIAAEAWHACRSDPGQDTPALFDIEALQPSVPAPAESVGLEPAAAETGESLGDGLANHVDDGATERYGDVPKHSPYQPGDRVQLHGFPNELSELGRTGFVGVVDGYLGGTHLTGVTDSGVRWFENWGALVREGEPNNAAASCTCCPRTGQRAPKRPAPVAPGVALTTGEDAHQGMPGPEKALAAQPATVAALPDAELADQQNARPVDVMDPRAEEEELLAELREEAESRAAATLAAVEQQDAESPTGEQLDASRSSRESQPDQSEPFSPVDLVRVAHACEDYAGNYVGGAMHLGPDAPARYVAEGHLDVLVQQYGFGSVWREVQRHLSRHPEILAAGRVTAEQREQRQTARDEAARRKSSEASREYRAGNFDRALELLAEGELLSPGYRPGNGRTWEYLRSLIRAKQAEALTGRGSSAPSEEAAYPTGMVKERPAGAAELPPTEPAAGADDQRVRPGAAAAHTAAERSAESAATTLQTVTRGPDGTSSVPSGSPERAFMLYRDGQSPQPLGRDAALKAFSAMIGQAEAGVQVAGRLGYAGAFISIGRTSTHEPRLRIAVGTRRDHQDVPIGERWPAKQAHVWMFDRIVKLLDNRAAVALLRRLHGVASRNPAEMYYMPHRGVGQLVNFRTAVDRFATMVDAVRETGSAPGELAWRGIAIRAHLNERGRVEITIASGADQIRVPLPDGWTTAGGQAEALRTVADYIDRAGQHADQLQQKAVLPAQPGPTAAVAPRSAAAVRSSAIPGQAFPCHPHASAGVTGQPQRSSPQPVAGAAATGRPR